jgi:hypothetical protein
MHPLCGVLVGAGSDSGHWLIHIRDETGIKEGSIKTGGQRQDDFLDNFCMKCDDHVVVVVVVYTANLSK